MQMQNQPWDQIIYGENVAAYSATVVETIHELNRNKEQLFIRLWIDKHVWFKLRWSLRGSLIPLNFTTKALSDNLLVWHKPGVCSYKEKPTQ